MRCRSAQTLSPVIIYKPAGFPEAEHHSSNLTSFTLRYNREVVRLGPKAFTQFQPKYRAILPWPHRSRNVNRWPMTRVYVSLGRLGMSVRNIRPDSVKTYRIFPS